MKITTAIKTVATTAVLAAKIAQNVTCHTAEQLAVTASSHSLKLRDHVRPASRTTAKVVATTVLTVRLLTF